MWRRNPRFKSDQIWFIWSYVSIWTKFNLRWHFIRCKILSTNFWWQKTFQTPIKRWKSHHRETLRPPDEVCKVLKFLFSEYSTVGFIFAFYHHTYPEANRKEAINLRLWNYGDEKYLPKCRNRDFLAGKQKFWTHISIQEQLNS